METRVGRSVFLWRQPRLLSQYMGPSVPRIFWNPYVGPYGLTYKQTKFGMATRVGRGVSQFSVLDDPYPK